MLIRLVLLLLKVSLLLDSTFYSPFTLFGDTVTINMKNRTIGCTLSPPCCVFMWLFKESIYLPFFIIAGYTIESHKISWYLKYIHFYIGVEAFKVSVCSHHCSSYNECKSAVYDERKEMCYLYNTTESFTCERKSDQTYIDKIGNSSDSNVGTIFSQTKAIIKFCFREH